MNEVHLRGVIKTEPWRYDGNLYVRVSVRRDSQRPGRATGEGGSFDYVTVLFPGGAQRGLTFQKNQLLAVHGWLQSRDVHENLTDFLQRAGAHLPTPPPPAAANGKPPLAKPNGNGTGHGGNGTPPPASPKAAPTPAELPAAVASGPGQTVVPGGKYKVIPLAQLAGTAEGCSYLYFLARKRTATTDADQTLAAAAEQVLLAAAAQHVQLAIDHPDVAMPVVPFGDEKDKRLDQAQPKWAAILAKKQDSDARTFQDLVLYGVARRLSEARGPANGMGFKRPSGLSPEQFTQLLAALHGIRSALEALARKA